MITMINAQINLKLISSKINLKLNPKPYDYQY